MLLYNQALPQLRAVVKFGNLDSSRISVEEFRAQKELIADKGYSIDSAKVYFSGAGFPSVQRTELNGGNLGGLSSFLSRCGPGSIGRSSYPF